MDRETWSQQVDEFRQGLQSAYEAALVAVAQEWVKEHYPEATVRVNYGEMGNDLRQAEVSVLVQEDPEQLGEWVGEDENFSEQTSDAVQDWINEWQAAHPGYTAEPC